MGGGGHILKSLPMEKILIIKKSAPEFFFSSSDFNFKALMFIRD